MELTSISARLLVSIMNITEYSMLFNLNLCWAVVLEEQIVGLQYNPFLKGDTQVINRFHTFVAVLIMHVIYMQTTVLCILLLNVITFVASSCLLFLPLSIAIQLLVLHITFWYHITLPS